MYDTQLQNIVFITESVKTQSNRKTLHELGAISSNEEE